MRKIISGISSKKRYIESMMDWKKFKHYVFWVFTTIFCSTGLLFAYSNIVNTTLWILPLPYQIIYTPAYVTGSYILGPVYVEITWLWVKQNTTGIYDNGIYTFWFYRWTWPFTTWAGFSSGNTRSYIQTTEIIDRIDTIPPTFAGITDGVTYNSAVTITFSDDHPGATATINGGTFNNWWTISVNGTYQLIVTDSVGHMTWATFIIYLNETPPPWNWWWGWWGSAAIGVRSMIEKTCETRSCYSYYYDDICWSCTPPKIPVVPYNWPPYHYVTPVQPTIQYSPYPKERNNAYLRAYKLGITTVSNIKDADLEAPLFRKFAAKMASEFAIKVVGLTPDESRKCNFNDIEKEIPELQYYMRLSCKLGIMGLDYYGEPDVVFNPNYIVTRDQFVTILSRILFRNEYNIKHGELTLYDKASNFISHSLSNISKALWINLNISTPLDWYTKHLEAIKKLWVITNYTLTIKEFRWYVMIIMYRLDGMGITKVKNLTEAVMDSLK